jgi:hypothetical protein
MSAKLFAMMQTYQVDPPDTEDVEDVRRALTQLRERLVVTYRHVASVGVLPAQVEATDLPQSEKAERLAALAELARPNTRRRVKRVVRARRNPLTPEEVAEAVDYVGADDADPSSVPGLSAALAQSRAAAQRQPLSRAAVDAMFPSEGTRTTWTPQQRFGEALTRYDLVSRLGALGPPPAGVDPTAPFTNRAALEYIIEASGLSLQEAQTVLRILKESADNKGTSGGDKAMQPSSAMCKASRTRKVSGYALPPDLAARAGFDSVVILVSPKGQQPRVMTFRHGSHIDCDLVGATEMDVFRLIGRALQISLYWLAEKPKRLPKTKVYVAQVGSPEVFLAWSPGSPISAEVALTFLRQGPTFRIAGGTRDISDYVRAVKATFGTSGVGPESRLRPPQPTRAAAAGRGRKVPSAPSPEAEGMSLDEAMAMTGRSALEEALRAVQGAE